MIRLRLKVTPGSGRTAVERLADGSFHVHVMERAVDGKANQAVIKLLSARFDVPKSRITVLQGANGRHKVIGVDSPDTALTDLLVGAAPVNPIVGQPR